MGQDKATVRAILDRVKKEGRTSLSAPECYEVCAAYGIPRLLTHNAGDFQRYSAYVRVESL